MTRQLRDSAKWREVHRYLFICLGVLVVWLLCEGAALLGPTNSPLVLTYSGMRADAFYYAVALTSAAGLHVWSRPGRGELIALGVAGLGLTLVLWLFGPCLDLPMPLVHAACFALGMGSLGILT
jgi:hypothetical protein